MLVVQASLLAPEAFVIEEAQRHTTGAFDGLGHLADIGLKLFEPAVYECFQFSSGTTKLLEARHPFLPAVA